MRRDHREVVRRGFAYQAKRFEIPGQTLNDPTALAWAVANLDLLPEARVLDVGGGTGLLARAVAPYVRDVTVVDVTPEMLAEGKRACAAAGIPNVTFLVGEAYHPPVPDNTFALVVCRSVLHHLENPEAAVHEMSRACRPGGRVGLIDMVASDDPKRATAHNDVERLRDPSHVRALTRPEIERLLAQSGLTHVKTVAFAVEPVVTRWLELTGSDDKTRTEVVARFEAERLGPVRTGLRPFVRGGELRFVHQGVLVLGAKPT